MVVTTGTIIWANLALIEEAVSATGKLSASGATLDVQAPVGGVVKQIFVIDGKQVHLGERLLTLDNTTGIAQMQSLQKIRASLVQENQFYQSQLKGATSVDVTKLKIPTEILDLTKSRATLIAENQVYRTQLDGSSSASKLTLEQRERILSNQAELDTRVTAAISQIDQLRRQFQQTDIKLVSTKDTLKMNQGILDNITPLMKDGGISKIQYFKQ
ncbi:biotin/lipoyl-binding protein [Tolypothrix sp. VBCCA 56010]|uniref:biotin/lipoyl-binding protein n=1 Tax=Tolypothrix sp. VBCCA 56010 TaxID=3137731 RepID=UPI003D7ED037